MRRQQYARRALKVNNNFYTLVLVIDVYCAVKYDSYMSKSRYLSVSHVSLKLIKIILILSSSHHKQEQFP